MVGRTFVLWLGLALGAGSLWAPTVASMEALEAQSQWQQARRVARPYRTALRADSVRLTDSLAYQILRTADHYGVDRRVAFGLVWTESRFKVDARRRLLRPPPRALPYPCLPRALQRPPRHLVLGPRGAELREPDLSPPLALPAEPGSVCRLCRRRRHDRPGPVPVP